MSQGFFKNDLEVRPDNNAHHDVNAMDRDFKGEVRAAQQQVVKETPKDKSKPISSTPVTGTPW